MIKLKVPASKSDTQRALFISSFTHESYLHNYLNCNDSQVLIKGLNALGVNIEVKPEQLKIKGNTEFKSPKNPAIYLENAGTAVRFMSALSLLYQPGFSLDGNSYMRKRPLKDMTSVLKSWGVNCRSMLTDKDDAHTLPIQFINNGVKPQPSISISTETSTQYLSGLLMIAPYLPGPPEFKLLRPEKELPYVDMTLKTMQSFGVPCEVKRNDLNEIVGYQLASNHKYENCNYQVEGDWSSASYIYAASFITGQPFEITNLDFNSLQGDKVIVSLTEQMKNLSTPLTLDMSFCPDIVPTVAAMAFHRNSTTTINGISKLRFKETDRIAVLEREFKKLGGKISTTTETMHIEPSRLKQRKPIDPSDDHRMAMAVRTALLPEAEVEVLDATCVNKSYPSFWKDIKLFVK